MAEAENFTSGNFISPLRGWGNYHRLRLCMREIFHEADGFEEPFNPYKDRYIFSEYFPPPLSF
jgi:hypothetical protein